MASSVAVFPCIGSRKLIHWLLGQPGRMAPSRSRRSLGLSFSSSLCSMPADLLLAGRRSQLCRGASPGPVWVLLPGCPTVRQSSSIRASAPLSLCWPLCRSDFVCSSSDRFTGGKMSSSSSTSSTDGQGKPKPKSPFRKRGSLQSTTSPGEWVRGGPIGRVRELSYMTVKSENYTDAFAVAIKNAWCLTRSDRKGN